MVLTTAEVDLAPPLVVRRDGPGGVITLRSPVPLARCESSLGEMLRKWAVEATDRVFLAERDRDAWRRVTYGEASESADAIAQALLDRGLGADQPLMILSRNSIEHAMLTLAGFIAGVPVVPVSPAYSLLSRDFAKLEQIATLVRPGLVYADDEARFARALGSVDFGGAEVVVRRQFDELTATRPTDAVERAFAAVGPDSVAKILFTSGSTSEAKGVVNTHRMLCANQQSLAQVLRFTAQEAPVLVDWLPWSHTFGGNRNFNHVLKHGGSLYIDEGSPRPGEFDATVRNLAEVSPTICFNVPAGYARLVARLEEDRRLRASFFARLRMIFYAGAALPRDLWERLGALSVAERGERVLMISGWGMTEAAPGCTEAHFHSDRPDNIGIPIPGVTVKMVPDAGTYELRVKGPNVMPGYHGRPDLTAAAFDEEGFFRTGDAAQLVDPADPAQGLVFDGRIVEDFKLATGTFVRVGPLRTTLLAELSPVLQDLVIAGHDREYAAMLAWPSVDAARALGDDREPVEQVRTRLREYNARQAGSSTRICRVLLMSEPPVADANEITDKGYVNQRAVLRRRAALVEELYAEPPGPRVIVAG
jgi:feruloyl-CoA synthase